MQTGYRLRIPHSVAPHVRGSILISKRRIKASLSRILLNPNEGKSPKGELAGLRSFRVGRFRIIYRFQKNHVEIAAIGPGERIYKETYYVLKE
jgi:mRNA-degrading endonuclease RelE of RelBE toxin-antitoxin system